MKWIILTLLFGWTGCYQFHKGRKGKGFLRLFTIGIFGIGWIIDFFASIKDAFQNRKKKNSAPPKADTVSSVLKDDARIQRVADGVTKIRKENYYAAPRPQGETINRYNMCLVRDGIDFYHTEEDCRFVQMASGWKQIPVTEAKKLKMTWCDECRFVDYKRRHPEKYNQQNEYVDEYIFAHDIEKDDSEEDDDA